MNTEEDQKIIEQFNNGKKKKAFIRLYKKYAEIVFKFVYSRVGDRSVSEDITAETFAVLYENLSSFKGESKLQSFIIGISLNKLKELWRENRKKISFLSIEDFVKSEDDVDLDRIILLEEEEGNQKENSDLVEKLLSKLPQNYSEVLRLKFIKNKSNKEISKVMKISVENVRQLQRRALIKASQIADKFI